MRMNRRLTSLVVRLSIIAAGWQATAADVVVVDYKAPAKLPDVVEWIQPKEKHSERAYGSQSQVTFTQTLRQGVKLEGYLGERVKVNARNRLAKVDEEPLLAGFRKKPGSHPWIGEHVGKWLHATSLAYAYSGDSSLRRKLDSVAAELIKAQEPDGYLGTYVPEKRFGLFPEADWDVWSHKYDLMGLLTYYQYTGNTAALDACGKIGDLLITTFGQGKKSILSAGTHMGMAATSVLEPVVLLYRFTGEEKYLEFARYIVRSWDEPNGPRIVASLLKEKSVSKTANGKAYEMLSNLVGLCELARATGDRQLLEPVLNAWQDIVAHQLYITGSASHGEHFHGDFDLPNPESAEVCETCVTTTWIQLNSQLLRLTGEARFANELERTFYNHLAAAQRPDGAEWCYFTSLEGKKPYGPGINCCVSSGPRGMALVAPHAYLKYHLGDQEGLIVNLFDTSEATVELGGQYVTVRNQSEFPRKGSAVLTLALNKATMFPMRLRSPDWAGNLKVAVNGKLMTAVASAGWLEIPSRKWKKGDQIGVAYELTGRVLQGDHTNAGKAALAWGPFVLAFDTKLNSALPQTAAVGLVADANPLTVKDETALMFAGHVRSGSQADPQAATFVPFADAGSDGGFYRVWMGAAGSDVKALGQ